MKRNLRRSVLFTIPVLIAALLAAVLAPSSADAAQKVSDPSTGKIKHIIWIMQENRSFDHYFGTFPGANGLPTDGNGHFLSSDCLYDPLHPTTPACPYHNYADTNSGGDHSSGSAIRDIDGGAMDGFVAEARRSYQHYDCTESNPTKCNQDIDAMGYHDAREIPNYWAYAKNFGLADNAFEFTPSYSLPSHLYMVSEWSGNCKRADGTWQSDPMRCNYDIDAPSGPDKMTNCQLGIRTAFTCPIFAWTSMTYLLHQAGQTWNYFIVPGEESDCTDFQDPTACDDPGQQASGTSNIWNPLTYFPDVDETGGRANIQDASNYFTKAANGTLPAVSWIVPSALQSEHPNAGLHGKSIHTGQQWVTSLVNAAMSGPDWDSTAIFVTWDDWGGMYDHVAPPEHDNANRQEQAGLRVPMLIISPYAKKGYINHTQLGLDSINRFIEDVFTNGGRLDPATDGRPDARGVVSEDRSWTGDLRTSFNFNQKPRAPMILDPNPLPGKPQCIDGKVCDTFYVTNMAPRTATALQTKTITVTAAGLKAGATVRVDSRNRLGIAPVKVTAIDANHHTITFQVTPVKNTRTDLYNVVVTNPGNVVASCNGCLSITGIDGAAPSQTAASTNWLAKSGITDFTPEEN